MNHKILLIIIYFLTTQIGFAQSKFGLEIQGYFSNSILFESDGFSGKTQNGSTGNDLGVGVFYKLSDKIRIKTGFHRWTKDFTSEINYASNIYNIKNLGELLYDCSLEYLGVYVAIDYQHDIFFIGGGIDFSFSKTFNGNLAVYEKDIQINEISDIDELPYVDKFNNQVDIIITTGFNLGISKDVTIKPSVSFSIPTISLFNNNHKYYKEKTRYKISNLHVALFKFGIKAEISFYSFE